MRKAGHQRIYYTETDFAKLAKEKKNNKTP